MCELMFGGECWITKIYTVLADCTTNHYTCCQGYQIAGHVTKGKNIHCVKQSGCGGVKRLTKNNGLSGAGQINPRNLIEHFLKILPL